MSTTTKTHVDLFSGIGGFALAARNYDVKTIAFCEKDKYCQRVLVKNFGAVISDTKGKRERKLSKRQGNQGERKANIGRCGEVRIEPEIKRFDGKRFAGVWLLTGGFPCQPYSVAGDQRGSEDDRALWPEMFRIVSEARPTWVIGENVAGFIAMELDNCISDLESIGYEVQAFVIPACAVDAKHRRDRVWIIAHANQTMANAGSQRRNGRRFCEIRNNRNSKNSKTQRRPKTKTVTGLCEAVSNNALQRLQGKRQTGGGSTNENGKEKISLRNDGDGRIWEPEPNVGRVVNGVPARMDRLKGLGNAIVPQVAEEIIKAIIEIEQGI